jgi:hypothetical protein
MGAARGVDEGLISDAFGSTLTPHFQLVLGQLSPQH